MSFRTATTTVDTSGATLFQSAWVDENGRISGFVPDESKSKVEKYFNSNTFEMLYKLFPMASEEMFIIESGNLWQSDSTGLNWTNIVPPEESYFDLSPTDTPVKLGDTYIVSSYNGGRCAIYTTTDFITFEYKISNYSDSAKLIKLSETEVVAIDYYEHEYHYSIDAGQTWGTVYYEYYSYYPIFFANKGKLASITDFYVDGYGYTLYEEKASISGANWDISYTSSTHYQVIQDITLIGDKIAFAYTHDGLTEFIAVLNQAPSGNSWTHDSIIFTSPTRWNNSWMRENILLINENLDYTFHFNPPGTNYSSATPPVSGDNVLFKNKKNNKYYVKSSTNILESNTPEGPWIEKTINVPLNIAWYF